MYHYCVFDTRTIKSIITSRTSTINKSFNGGFNTHAISTYHTHLAKTEFFFLSDRSLSGRSPSRMKRIYFHLLQLWHSVAFHSIAFVYISRAFTARKASPSLRPVYGEIGEITNAFSSYCNHAANGSSASCAHVLQVFALDSHSRFVDAPNPAAPVAQFERCFAIINKKKKIAKYMLTNLFIKYVLGWSRLRGVTRATEKHVIKIDPATVTYLWVQWMDVPSPYSTSQTKLPWISVRLVAFAGGAWHPHGGNGIGY